MAGQRIAQFEIAGPLGAGGMGEVFRARDTRLSRDVAVKLLPKDFVADADRLRRFEQEAKTLAALNHPNVLTVFDAGVHEGAPYLVTELLEGKTLREEMNGAALPVRKAIEYALQIGQEAKTLAALNLPNVLTIHDAVTLLFTEIPSTPSDELTWRGFSIAESFPLR